MKSPSDRPEASASEPSPASSRRAQNPGDGARVSELLADHRPRLRDWVRRRLDRRLQGRVDASDVVQDVCLEAARRYDHFLEHRSRTQATGEPTTEISFAAWLESLARDRLTDLRRWHGRKKRALEREVPKRDGSAHAVEFVAEQSSPSWTAMQKERDSLLRTALSALDDHDREILELREFQGHSNRDAARRLGLNEAASSARYIRALSRLGQLLEEGGTQP